MNSTIYPIQICCMEKQYFLYRHNQFFKCSCFIITSIVACWNIQLTWISSMNTLFPQCCWIMICLDIPITTVCRNQTECISFLKDFRKLFGISKTAKGHTASHSHLLLTCISRPNYSTTLDFKSLNGFVSSQKCRSYWKKF